MLIIIRVPGVRTLLELLRLLFCRFVLLCVGKLFGLIWYL